MKTIMEYQFCSGSIEPIYKVEMPKDSVIVHVGVSHGQFMAFWAMVDLKKDQVTRKFHIIGSYNKQSKNCEIQEHWHYHGTFVLNNGQVFHLFEDWA